MAERDSDQNQAAQTAAANLQLSSTIQKPKLFVSREKTTPFLVKVFVRTGGHHRDEDFSVRERVPKDELHIYTWRDANLRELTNLVKEVNPAAKKRDVRLSFAFVYPDKRGRMVLKEVGKIHSTKKGDDDEKTLDYLHFETGDYIDVAIV